MRSLLLALAILATPLSAGAQGGWREHRGGGGGYGAAPAQRYQAPARRPNGPAPRGGQPQPAARPPGPVYNGPPGGPAQRPPWQQPQERARDQVRMGQRVPLPQVIERLRRTTGAEYIDTREGRAPNGRPLYILRFRQHGRYIDVPVDAETGDVQR
jgi:hypothetical protein